MSDGESPVNLRGLPHANFYCKGCDPERRFWSEHDLVKHIIEERKKEAEKR